MKDNKYNQIKALLAIANASLKANFRNPSVIVFSIVFPLVFILIFGFLGGNNNKISIAFTSNTDKENQVYKTLTGLENIKVKNYSDFSAIDSDLKKGQLDGLLDITSEPQISGIAHTVVKLTTSEASPQSGALLQSIISGIVDKTNLAFAQIKTPAVSLETSRVSGRKFKMIDFILPGQLGFSLLNIGVIGTAFVFLSLRETLVLKRFFATPVTKTTIILGQTLARLVFSMIQAVVIIGIGTLFLGFTLVNGWITLLQMLLLAGLGLLVFMGFGYIISGLAKNSDAVPPLANLVTLPQFLLAGTFFPVESFPSWLQPVSKILPLTYLNDAMRKVAFEGANLWNVNRQILVLLLWGIAIYIIAVKTFKWE